METVERVGRGWYNYYHQKSRVETPDGKAMENWYDRDLSKEEVNASNDHTLNRESYGADLCRTLYEAYAGVAAANRARYSNVKDMRSAVNASICSAGIISSIAGKNVRRWQRTKSR